jgi:RNA methyltransferase, TrmH family
LNSSMHEPIITSVQNPRVKDAARLRDRRHRERQGRFLIDGAREILRALQAGIKLEQLFVCEAQCRSDEADQALGRARSNGVEILPVTPQVFGKLAFGDRAEGILAVAATPRSMLADLPALVPELLVAVLAGVEKPGNIGAVLRTADAAGVSAVILADPRTDLFNPNAIRASLGTIFTVPIAVATAAETLAWLREKQCRILTTRVEARLTYSEAEYRGPTAIVLGSEAQGLSGDWTGADIVPVRVPMLGIADSLNVSATAAVLFYEALRQRGAAGQK